MYVALDNVMSASFNETTKFVAAYGLYLAILLYEMYSSKKTNFVVGLVSGSTIISNISGLFSGTTVGQNGNQGVQYAE